MKKICELNKEDYVKLKYSSMFWKLYPEATGDYVKDWKLSKNCKFQIECKKIESNEI